MRRIIVLVAALAVVAGGCGTAPTLLNSERIASKYGNYGVEIIAYEDGVRYSNLYSKHDGARICRTYATVRFHPEAASRLRFEHEQVLQGRSIGATFKSNGWQVSKQTLYLGEIELASVDHDLKKLMKLDDGAPLAMHVYRLWLRKGPQDYEYATIIEVHHSDYLNYRQLQRLFSVDTNATPSATELLDWHALIVNVEG